MKIIPVDFETEGIENRPEYPPKPVGVAIKWEGKNKYYAWGHPTENNCTKREVQRILKEVFKNYVPLFHHAAFDINVASKHLFIRQPQRFHDTLFLAYLHDPRDSSLSLKPLAEKYLGMPPEEQTKLKEWILKYVYKAQGIKETKANPWGAHIAEAPGKLVGKYAIGDIDRTERLLLYFYDYVKENGMLEAYEREKLCMPIFEQMSKTGIRIAKIKLQKDLRQWEKDNEQRAKRIRKRLKTPELDITSSPQLAKALDKTGKVDEWIYTAPTKTYPAGQKSTKRENLIKVCTDKKLVKELANYGIMSTLMSTFAVPWLESANKFGSRVYPNFNQVRSTDEYGGKSKGTRTGRPSSDHPNFLNVPRNQEGEDLPWMRNYIIPDEGCSFLIRDYNQQELRILAHFERGLLYQSYLDDPNMDAHNLVGGLIKDAVGIAYPRKHIKTVNFGVVYGMGKPGLADAIGGTLEEAGELLTAHRKALPGVKDLSKAIQKVAKKDEPIITWGGREYYVEEPKMIQGRRKEFYYKLLNYLIQGSAADCTKEAMIRVESALDRSSRIVLQVYDEIVVCCEKGKEKKEMKKLKEAMESIEFDIPMLTDGKVGRRSWGQAVDYKD